MNELIRIALAEDNPVNRSTFLQKMQDVENCEVVFVAQDGNECLQQLKGLPHKQLPAVIFMDIEMPGMNGIQAIGMGKAIYPHLHFIVLTVFDDDDKIFEAIKAGASGYLLKHEPAVVLEEAIRNVVEIGGAPMSPAIARKTLQLLSRSTVPKKTESLSVPDEITERECEILQHLVNGWDAKRIAVATRLSVLTVRKHIANIYGKLHVNSRAQAIQMAHKAGWFE